MLTELSIDNFAIIDHLQVTFGDGLITLTGETGAGKSILLDAIMVLMGGRADATLIRSGADRALVEGTFHLTAPRQQGAIDILAREDLLEEADSVVLAREIRREGRSVARVNGRSGSASLLKELGAYLVDIHGQSEHLSLLNVHEHLGLLDRYAGSGYLLDSYRTLYHDLTQVRRELHALQQDEADAARQIDLLNYQIQEIDNARLKPGEDDLLKQEQDRLANAESLADTAQKSLALLEGVSPEAPSITEMAGELVRLLAALERMDGSQSQLRGQVENAAELLNDAALELQDYADSIEFNPRRLEQVIERLELVRGLCRKYGGSIEAVLAFGGQSRRKLESITHAGERIAELQAKEAVLLAELAQQAKALSAYRKDAAAQMSQAIERELDDLSMASARFSVDFQLKPHKDGLPLDGGMRAAFDAAGMDVVEFLIAPNPGEGLKPLVKIASGGETSRLMLALKNVLAQADYVPTLIFDEIDQGIGGRVGNVVGEKLWRLGRDHQVLCVTHLPQLAAYGDQHLRIQKEISGGRTLTRLQQLDDGMRLEELAVMLGANSDASRSAARETLDTARKRAEQLTAEYPRPASS